jgi:ATP-dependent helicase/nuclease subunit A
MTEPPPPAAATPGASADVPGGAFAGVPCGPSTVSTPGATAASASGALAAGVADELAADAAARERAVTPASFLVEAPAGAGKTELLTQRFLALLARVEAPEEVLAITFTRKAAAEMRGRIVRNLVAASSGAPPVEPHKRITFALAQAALAHGNARGWDLTRRPARLRILTIDALCALLARQAPLVSRIGGTPRIAEDPEPHYEEAARRSVALLEGGDAGQSACVADALRHLDNDIGRLTGVLAAMLSRRDQWLRHGRPTDAAAENRAAMRALVEATLRPLASAIDADAQRRLLPLAAQAVANAPEALASLAGWQAPLSADWESLPGWQALAAWLLTSEGGFRKAWTVRQGFVAGKPGAAAKAAIADWVAALPPAAEAALATAGALPTPQQVDAEAPLIEALAKLLWLAAAQLWLVFAERREVDFIAVAEAALRALGEADAPSELALDYRVSHLLVDEFQDTSPGQIELLERLTAGWADGGGADEVASEGRTLFCVGDPMQSIYRFRKAEVALFREAGRRGIGELRLATLQLARNNRSDRALVGWINDSLPTAFATAASAPGDEAIAYRPCVATREDRAGSGARWHPVICEAGVSAAVAASAEASALVALIGALRGEDPTRQIAVLVRARRHLAPLIAALRRERPDLPFEAVEIDPLESRQAVRDIVILVRALAQLADRVHWLALLRSPLVGLTLADLHALITGSGKAPVWPLLQDAARLAALSADGQARVARLRAVLGPALAHAGRQRFAHAVEGVWLALGGPATVADDAALADCRAAFDRLDALVAAGRFSIDTLAADFARLFAAPDPRGAGLTLMTIHKAKGLEFDTVILPALHGQPGGRGDLPLLRWEPVVAADGTRHTAVAALPPRGGEAGAAYRLIGALEAARVRAEAARVLYVGATRARRALHLSACAWRTKDDDGLRDPHPDSLLALLWPTVRSDWSALPARVFAAAAAAAGDRRSAFVPPLRRLSAAALDAAAEVFGSATAAGGEMAPVEQAPVAPRPGVQEAGGQEAGGQEAGGQEAGGQGAGGQGAADQGPAVHRAADQGPGVRQPGVCAAPAGGRWRPGRHRREALLGTLAHRYLERIAAEGPEAWPPERIAALPPAMSRWLVREGLPAAEAQSAAGELAAMLQTTLASADCRRVLAAGGEAELALVSEDRDGRRVQVVDRSFVADGVRWIVDYKTEVVEPRSDAGFAAAAERHRGQLARYAALFAGEGRPVRCAVLFVRYGRLADLPSA